jgi:hypothetical protein
MLLSLTTGEWIIAAGSTVVLLLSVVPLVWLGWRFVQMSDDAVALLEEEQHLGVPVVGA